MRSHIDLFSGIGGFAIAAQNAGFTTIAFSEIEPYACKILKRHWPDVPNFGDIRNVRGIAADLVTGGTPCQPASCAGQRRGPQDDRWLWPEAIDCVERIKPTFCLFENPTGILSLNGGLEFERVLSRLESLGYSVQPIVIPACAVDAKHRRDRVWIVAYSDERAGIRGVSRTDEWPVQKRNGEGDETLADTGRELRREWRTESGQAESATHVHNQRRCEDVPDAEAVRRNERNQNGGRHGEGETEAQEWSRPADYHRWPVESGFCRVANGVPNRSHRLKGLGNAIVPQVAYQILRHMNETLSPQQTKQ